jgi:hypothetical protein
MPGREPHPRKGERELPQNRPHEDSKESKNSMESKGLRCTVRHAERHAAIAALFKLSFLAVYQNA